VTEYNKLVRDKIPEICAFDGLIPIYHRVSGTQLVVALCKKLVEEALELETEPSLEELADVHEVVDSLDRQLGYLPSQIESARTKKSEEKGSFDLGIILERVD